MTKRDVFQEITDKLIAKMEEGASKWRMPWVNMGGLPTNAATGRLYSGLNAITLWATPYETQHWGTYKQWQSVGAQVRKGSQAELVLVPMTVDRTIENEKGETERQKFMYWRGAPVFNSEQVDNWTAPTDGKVDETEVVAALDDVVHNSGIRVTHGHDKAAYVPMFDEVQMPDRIAFISSDTQSATEAYYGTLVHELVHATGHESRLGRALHHRFGSEAYAMEELVAELGSAFVAGHTGLTLEPKDENAAYLKSWLKVLKNDKKAIHVAATQASKAALWLLEGGENETV